MCCHTQKRLQRTFTVEETLSATCQVLTTTVDQQYSPFGNNDITVFILTRCLENSKQYLAAGPQEKICALPRCKLGNDKPSEGGAELKVECRRETMLIIYYSDALHCCVISLQQLTKGKGYSGAGA